MRLLAKASCRRSIAGNNFALYTTQKNSTDDHMPAFTSAFTIWVTITLIVKSQCSVKNSYSIKSAAVVHKKFSETNGVKKPLIKFVTHPSKTLSAPPTGFTAPPTTSPAALHVLFPGPCRHMEARTPGEPSRVFPAASHWSAHFW